MQADYWRKILNSGNRKELIYLLHKVGLDKDSINIFLNKFDEIDKELEHEKSIKFQVNIEIKRFN